MKRFAVYLLTSDEIPGFEMHAHGTFFEGKIRSPHFDTVGGLHVDAGVFVSGDGSGRPFKADG